MCNKESGQSKAVFMCTICTRVQICTREQIYTRVQICTPLCRVHMPINCVHTHIDLIGNLTQGTHFYGNSLGLNALNDSNSVLSRCMCVGGREGGGASSICRRQSVWLKISHSIHLKAKSDKHIHNMTTIFYLYDCISFNDLP